MPNVNSYSGVNTTQIIQGAGPVVLDGVVLGGFRDGVTITYNETHSFTKSDCALGEIDGEVMSSEMSVNTVLEQNTARNMCVAMGANTSSSSSSSSSISWDFGPEMAVTPKALDLYGMSAMDKLQACKYTFSRVVRIGQTAQTLKRGTEQLLPVTFKCLLNSSGKYYNRTEPIPLASIPSV
jgi:hypothetical protein